MIPQKLENNKFSSLTIFAIIYGNHDESNVQKNNADNKFYSFVNPGPNISCSAEYILSAHRKYPGLNRWSGACALQ
jgi:hypothetical protein